MKLLKALNENILIEVSEKVKNQLYSKFKDETSDDKDIVMSYIDLFDRYKESFPSTKRDITKYSYKELKSVIDDKRFNKQVSDETRKKLSESHNGEKHPMFGKKHTIEAK